MKNIMIKWFIFALLFLQALGAENNDSSNKTKDDNITIEDGVANLTVMSYLLNKTTNKTDENSDITNNNISTITKNTPKNEAVQLFIDLNNLIANPTKTSNDRQSRESDKSETKSGGVLNYVKDMLYKMQRRIKIAFNSEDMAMSQAHP